MAVWIFCRIFFLAWCHRYFWFIRIRAGSRCGCYVYYLAFQNIRFCYHIFCVKLFGFSRSKSIDCPLITCQIVCYRNICNCQISIICYRNLISNGFSKYISVFIFWFACSLLVNCQVAVWIFCRIFFLAWCHRYFWFIRIRAGSRCGCYVYYLAFQNIGFCYYIFCSKFFAFSWCKRIDCPLITCQIICYRNVCNCQISIIRYRNLISNGFSKYIRIFIFWFVCSFLVNCQVAVRIFCRIFLLAWCHRYIRYIRIRTGSCCSCHVYYLAFQNIRFCYHVFCGKFFAFSWCKRIDCPLIICQIICYPNVCNCQISIIYYSNCIIDCLAQYCFLVFFYIRGLDYGQMTILLNCCNLLFTFRINIVTFRIFSFGFRDICKVSG